MKLLMLKNGFVYILTNKNQTTFYIGVTGDLKKRIAQHKNGDGSEFTSKYKLIYLVYYEQVFSMDAAIKREKQLKNWHRQWKLNLIREHNPEMKDLYYEL